MGVGWRTRECSITVKAECCWGVKELESLQILGYLGKMGLFLARSYQLRGELTIILLVSLLV